MVASQFIDVFKDCSFVPSDASLFEKFCSSISLASVDQVVMVNKLIPFFLLHRRSLCLSHLPPSVTVDQKTRLLSSPPFSLVLF